MTLEFLSNKFIKHDKSTVRLSRRIGWPLCCVNVQRCLSYVDKRKKVKKKKKEGGFFNDGARDAINRTRGEGEEDTDVSHQHIIPWEYSGGGGTR